MRQALRTFFSVAPPPARAAAALRKARRHASAVGAAPVAAAAKRRPGVPAASRVFRRDFSDFVAPGSDPEEGGKLRLSFAASCRPHPNKVKRGGEDGYFACPSSGSFGVADGVGGWAETGVDPGEFARRLLAFAYEEIRNDPSREQLLEAFHVSASRLVREEVQGGSTALFGQLCDRTLAILNLGDSGILVLRPALRTPPGSDTPLLFPRVIFRSSDQTHYFNCPYQLGSSNAPVEVPDLIHVRLREGDLVIAATDGVFDNLFDRQVQAIVARHLGGLWRTGSEVEPQLQNLAETIVNQAQKIGEQEDHKDIITPFALSAHSEGLSFRGGKLDDTTAVIGLVCRCVDDDAPKSGSKGAPLMPMFHNWRQ